jgi:hypothetical protein
MKWFEYQSISLGHPEEIMAEMHEGKKIAIRNLSSSLIE